jgi:hypothetical protein
VVGDATEVSEADTAAAPAEWSSSVGLRKVIAAITATIAPVIQGHFRRVADTGGGT